MNLSATGFAGATALCMTLWSQEASAQPSAATNVYSPPPPTASVYSPAPSRDYPSLAQPSSGSRVTGFVEREEACRGFDCLPSFDDRLHWMVLISLLCGFVGFGSLAVIKSHKGD